MRIKNSFAAAVAAAVSAVVFSAAFQPAEAAYVTIDSFTNVSTPNPVTGSLSTTGGSAVSLLTIIPNNSTSPSSNVLFSDRVSALGVRQSGGSSTTQATLSGTYATDPSAGGSLAWTLNKTAVTGSSNINLQMTSFLNYFPVTTADLTTNGGSGPNNDTIVINKSGGSLTGDLGAGGFVELIFADVNGNESQYFVTPSLWFSGTSVAVPYSSFTALQAAPVDMTKITQFGITVQYQNLSGNSTNDQRLAAFNGTATITDITIVPEPSHMVFVAGVGAVLGAWRLRNVRRSRMTAGDATAG